MSKIDKNRQILAIFYPLQAAGHSCKVSQMLDKWMELGPNCQQASYSCQSVGDIVRADEGESAAS